jgi:hypothetical protein
MTIKRTSIAIAAAGALALGVASSAVVMAAAAPRFSSASAKQVQSQPRAGTCHARGPRASELPDRRCTPGLRNPAVTVGTIHSTICVSGWTATVRPSSSITTKEKRASMAAYGAKGSAATYEYDHLIPLELGGAVNAAGNLWPEPSFHPKDRLENALKRLVCSGKMPLLTAQELIATNWVVAYHKYG